jgi:Fic family protein
MSSGDLRIAREGLFDRIDQKKDRVLKSKDPSSRRLVWRSPQMVYDWALNDCRLDEVQAEDLERAVENHQGATEWLFAQNEVVELDSEVLKTIHFKMAAGLSAEAGKFRSREAAPLFLNHDPSDPAVVPSAVDRLLGWITADSFAELHPIQQSALTLIRLLDIVPFREGSGRTSRVAANLFLVRADFPPAIFPQGQFEDYGRAIEAGFNMDTTPLTHLITSILNQTLEMLGAN